MPYWSVVQTESRRENVAADFLQRDFIVYFPKIATRNNSRQQIAPLFPGYLFIEIADRWWQVRWTTGVVRLLTIDGHPAKVPLGVVDDLRNREIDGVVQLPQPKQKPKRMLKAGDVVKIVRGPCEGRLGIYQGQPSSQRTQILLNLLGREVKVLVPPRDVVRVG